MKTTDIDEYNRWVEEQLDRAKEQWESLKESRPDMTFEEFVGELGGEYERTNDGQEAVQEGVPTGPGDAAG